MSRKHRKQIQRGRDAGLDLALGGDALDGFLEGFSTMVMYVEAAGGLDRAIRLMPLVDEAFVLENEDIERWRQITPRSRGGDCDDPMGCQLWEGARLAITAAPERRKELALLCRELSEVEERTTQQV
jgi:hypothetical protein